MDLTNINTIKNLCREFGIKPEKKLGQNFLVDKDVLAKIVAAAELQPADTVLEIGSGFGTLTCELVKYAGQVVAVEKDKRLAAWLIKTLKHENIKTKLKIVNDDILKVETMASLVSTVPYKIVANLPYQITSPVLWKFLHEDPLFISPLVRGRNSGNISPLVRGRDLRNTTHLERQGDYRNSHGLPTLYPSAGGEHDKKVSVRPELLVLMVQKEVGERICATAGEMSVLSVMCQFYAQCEKIMTVPSSYFWPVPDVDSMVIKLVTSPQPSPYQGEGGVTSPQPSSRIKYSADSLKGGEKRNNHPQPPPLKGGETTGITTPYPPLTPPEEGNIQGEGVNEKDFFRLVKIGFAARRKMLKNNLAAGFKIEPVQAQKILKRLGLSEKIRAQDITVREWTKILTELPK